VVDGNSGKPLNDGGTPETADQITQTFGNTGLDPDRVFE